MVTWNLVKNKYEKWQKLAPAVKKLYFQRILKTHFLEIFWPVFIKPILPLLLFTWSLIELNKEWYIKIGLTIVLISLLVGIWKAYSIKINAFLKNELYQNANMTVPNDLKSIHQYWEQNDQMREWGYLREIFSGDDSLYHQMKYLFPFIQKIIDNEQK